MTDKEITKLLELSDEEIFFIMGEKLGFKSLGLNSDEEKKTIVQMTKDWYKKNKNELKLKICASGKINLALSHQTSVAVVRVISDIIAHHFIGFPPVEISTIIFREGVKNICSENT